MTTQQTSIASKIKKLLALAKDPTNEHQAAAAAAKAQELLFQYNLSMAEVSTTDEETSYVSEKKKMTKQDKVWRSLLYSTIAKENWCFSVNLTGTDRCEIVGKASNIEVVNYLFDYLAKSLVSLSAAASKEELGTADWSGSRFRRGFHLGAISSIRKRLQAQRIESEDYARRAEAEAGKTGACTALVVKSDADLKQAVGKYIPSYKSSTISDRARGSNAGYGLGVEAGQRIALNRGIGGRQAARIS